MSPLTLLLPLLAACQGDDPKDSDEPADTAPPEDTAPPFDTGDLSGLHGEPPPAFLPAPTFEVQAQDGTPRDRDHLLGHPTVIWFYPMAATGG